MKTKFVNTKQAAEMLGVSQRMVLSLIQRGKIPASNIASWNAKRAYWTIPVHAIEKRLRANGKGKRNG